MSDRPVLTKVNNGIVFGMLNALGGTVKIRIGNLSAKLRIWVQEKGSINDHPIRDNRILEDTESIDEPRSGVQYVQLQ